MSGPVARAFLVVRLAPASGDDDAPSVAPIRACVSAIREGRATATHGNSSAASDVKVGYRLLIAAAEGARDNVDINLSGLTDVALQTVIRDEVTTLMNEAAAHGRSVLAV